MIQLSTTGPPGPIGPALGSTPVIPRHHIRRASAGTDPSVSRHTHNHAASRPTAALRRTYSFRKSAITSSRSASGRSIRKITKTSTGRCGGSPRDGTDISAVLSFYIVETERKDKGFIPIVGFLRIDASGGQTDLAVRDPRIGLEVLI